MNIFQRGLLGEVVHDHFSQRCKIRMEQNMPLLFRQFADLEAPRFQFRKELQRDPGFQTDNIIQKGGIYSMITFSVSSDSFQRDFKSSVFASSMCSFTDAS